MTLREWRSRLLEGAALLDLDVPPKAIDDSYRFQKLLLEWNDRINLTAHKTPQAVLELHFLDSWLGSRLLRAGSTVLDIGSGGGFPGIALKLICPDIELTSLDSTKKKCTFQRTVARELGLQIKVKSERAEEHVGTYEVVTGRAVANLVELATPHVAKNGYVLTYQTEVEDADLEAELPFSRAPRALKLFHVKR